MARSPVCFSNRLLTVTSLLLVCALPAAAHTIPPTFQSTDLPRAVLRHADTPQSWLQADKDDQDDKKGRDDDRKRNRDRDDDDRSGRIDLNRAKNLARQAAEAANGGLRVYRAEASMHGPANRSPFVDNGDSWTWTFLGGRPGMALNTIETVVTVYKQSRRVVVNYNGVVRSVRTTTTTSTAIGTTTSTTNTTTVSTVTGGQIVRLTNGYRITFRDVTYTGNTSTWRYYVEELPEAQDLSNWVLGLPACVQIVSASPKGEFVNSDPNARIRGIKWQPGGGFEQGEFTVTLRGRWAVGTTMVAVKGPDVARAELPGPSCGIR